MLKHNIVTSIINIRNMSINRSLVSLTKRLDLTKLAKTKTKLAQVSMFYARQAYYYLIFLLLVKNYGNENILNKKQSNLFATFWCKKIYTSKFNCYKFKSKKRGLLPKIRFWCRFRILDKK